MILSLHCWRSRHHLTRSDHVHCAPNQAVAQCVFGRGLLNGLLLNRVMLNWQPGSGIVEAAKEAKKLQQEKVPAPVLEKALKEDAPRHVGAPTPAQKQAYPPTAFTGEECQHCKSLDVLKTGTCGVCLNCGEPTSCT